MAEDLNGLLNIGFGSDSEPEEAADPKTSSSNGVTSRADRNALSEADFQALKQSYQAKVENGDIYKTITLPLPQTTAKNGVAKPEAQEILHAVEELYFFRRYTEGLDFTQRVLGDEHSSSSCPLDDETKSLLKYYGERCKQRISSGQSRS
ncbi:hypothetical protein QBC37DRAFT_426928 [Rhypophila decipiens]|uniref:Uncharacterized protein n=1 Tax=Rhypophila decipiens TaxID=261697 RepID=A0AAN6Y7A7_9PEZI|nr:hypothetical protein QBC37DRAFT_426928 [Rhypophila decipiens]